MDEKYIHVKLFQDIGFPVHYAINAEKDKIESVRKECDSLDGFNTASKFEALLKKYEIPFIQISENMSVDIQTFGERLNDGVYIPG